MAIVIRTSLLRRDMALRGWTCSDLARRSGVSTPTVSAVLRGRPARPSTIRRIAEALHREPVIEKLDDLLPAAL